MERDGDIFFFNPFGRWGDIIKIMTTGASVLERVIKPRTGGFSDEHARYVLSLDFSPEEQARYAELAHKVQLGTLTEQEQADLDDFVAANALLTILQSKARVSLRQHNSAA
jgi:hypothetical protein